MLCPTWWTVKEDSLHSILEPLDFIIDSERQLLIVVSLHTWLISTTCTSLAFLLVKSSYSADNLSQTLQHTEMSAAEGQSVVALSLHCLKKL